MRTSDRSLLQTLGFADPDKGNEEHDLACRYLTVPDVMTRLVDVLKVGMGHHDAVHGHRPDKRPKKDQYWGGWTFNQWSPLIPDHTGVLEKPIMRGNYHIGFTDVVIETAWSFEEHFRAWKYPPGREYPPYTSHSPYTGEEAKRRDAERDAEIAAYDQLMEPGTIPDTLPAIDKTEQIHGTGRTVGIEVKIGQSPIGNIIRQIKLYGEYLPARWVLATRYALNVSEVEALNSEGITHIRLGAGLDAYLVEVKKSAPADSVDI